MENAKADKKMSSVQVLFVCLGNICRSPTAEAVMNSWIAQQGLSFAISCDSAGTSGYHDGEEADARSITHSQDRGHLITSVSRSFQPTIDFEKFDYIVAMDDANYSEILRLDKQQKFVGKVFKLVQFCTRKKYNEVPDPYYGGPDAFELVIDILEDGCHGLLEKIKTDHKL